MIRAALVAVSLGCTAFLPDAACAQPPAQAPNPADSLLERMAGSWRMTGQVRGNPVAYDLVATRTLAGRYVELHMRDTAQVPRYEARVFIGADTVPGKIIAHWLDSFGAAYSIPHGAGEVRGDTVEFHIAYPSRTFRDTFIFRRAEGAWHLRIEAADGQGGWSLFAEYQIHPVTSGQR